jgi:enterochelin esterase family protein
MEVSEDGVDFVLADRHRRLSAVRLAQELGLRRGLRFRRDGAQWRLRLRRPAVDRMEYLFELRDHNGNRRTITDPTNPLRAPGAFGDKSVVQFPGYTAPEWFDAPAVDEQATELEDGVTVWSPAGLDAATAAPLLLVHDGPEYVSLGALTQYLGAGISAGLLPPTRAVLLGPDDRNAEYSANPAHAAWIADDLLPRLPPSTVRIGIGASLGALAMLHLHRSHPEVLDGLFLQSGSFFTPELDPQESAFSGYDAVTKFVASVHETDADDHPVPTTLTCGGLEENLANNAAMTTSLGQLGYASQLIQVRDAHNYTAWRDALHPALTELIGRVARAS